MHRLCLISDHQFADCKFAPVSLFVFQHSLPNFFRVGCDFLMQKHHGKAEPIGRVKSTVQHGSDQLLPFRVIISLVLGSQLLKSEVINRAVKICSVKVWCKARLLKSLG